MYGLRVEGLTDGALLTAVPDAWPRLAVVRDRPSGRRRPDHVGVGRFVFDDVSGEVWLDDETSIELERLPDGVAVRTRLRTDVSDDALAHPFLGLPAAVASHWMGRQVLHGGAFERAGGAWGILATKEGGKSSTLAWLHRHGHTVLSDDLLVLDGTTVFTGPRCVDLRDDAGAVLGGEDLGVVGGRERWRTRTPQVPASFPLAGLVHLDWGDGIAVEPLDPATRLTEVLPHAVFTTGVDDPSAFLELAVLPAFRLVRPRSLDALDASLGQLLDALGS
jgi:hypothetical protein